ncbi:acyltransferase [Paenibacillus sp. alder61]|uniref:acyltransferase family protein n=1 Tax=Paenibacillus sp. alder61 TaxID=2862948 RepID=UPI001CD29444|nr:acyltransferase [Paenibacillus sp. alder61]MCA1292181.1 acyltransferase [Paenibacillus sp. alder61]
MMHSGKRIVYLDRLKTFMTILVILHHTAITYGGAGDWYYVDPGNDGVSETILTIFTTVNQTFFMGLFFFISGYVTPSSYDRKGGARFLSDRLLRFGLPILAYMTVIGPLVNGISQGFNGSFASYAAHDLLTDSWRGIVEFQVGPLWFLVALLLFCGGYALYRQAADKLSVRFGMREISPGPRLFFGYLLAVSLGNFAVRLVYPVGETFFSLQLGYFPAYIALFFGGIAASRGRWLEKLTAVEARRWRTVALIVLVLLLAVLAFGGAADDISPYMGGWTWQSAVYSAADPVLGFALSYGLLVYFRDARNHPYGKYTAWLPGAAFAAYIIHPLFVTGVTYAMRHWTIFPLLKFGIAAALIVPLTFAAAGMLKRVPGLKKGL